LKTGVHKNTIGIYLFAVLILLIGIIFNYRISVSGYKDWIKIMPFIAGLVAFALHLFLDQRPFMELYSKSYPYRKLKLYGWICTFVLFEFVLVWGLSTGQISLQGEDLIAVNILLLGAIIFYHLFVRMKISLRFLFMGILIPLLAAGTALGLANYFNIIRFVAPTDKIGSIVFLNSIYWVMYAIFFQTVSEEPAFRGYLMQKLLYKGEVFAILYSSVIYGLWRVLLVVFTGRTFLDILLHFVGSCIAGAILAVLFVKGRNLLVSVICNGIIYGVWMSFFARANNPGISQYIEFSSSWSGTQIAVLWYLCLSIGLLLLTFIPRKNLSLE
jgi:membrane protease YdiL (CAAX protease family)